MSENADRRSNGQFQRGNRFRLRRDGEPPPADLNPSRAKLRQQLARHREEVERLAGLEAALDRCHAENRDARSAHQASVEALTKARHIDRTDLAFRFANREVVAKTHEIEAAEALVARNKAELERLSEIEEALDEEVRQSQQRATMRQMSAREALSEVICSSETFNSLLERLDALHAEERGLHKAFRTISSAIGGLPDIHFRRINRVTSLDPDVIEPIDTSIAERWSAALSALREDADAPLPDGGRE
jgi:hypothetical protein